ncbi:MAG TPA: phage terminase small subunit P27 family [Planctomycetota bacterium]|nr:phage terminase small subunit P27 family [Planctomycetota bacterium]
MPRTPKPTVLKILEGNPGKRKLNAAEPKLKAAAPDCPVWVSGPARQHWPEIASQLAEMGVSTTADKIALGLLVDAMGQYIEAKRDVEEAGLTFTSEGTGAVHVHPSVSLMQNAWERIVKALREFGLTPASRTKVHAIVEQKQDEFEQFMRARNGSC